MNACPFLSNTHSKKRGSFVADVTSPFQVRQKLAKVAVTTASPSCCVLLYSSEDSNHSKHSECSDSFTDNEFSNSYRDGCDSYKSKPEKKMIAPIRGIRLFESNDFCNDIEHLSFELQQEVKCECHSFSCRHGFKPLTDHPVVQALTNKDDCEDHVCTTPVAVLQPQEQYQRLRRAGNLGDTFWSQFNDRRPD